MEELNNYIKKVYLFSTFEILDGAKGEATSPQMVTLICSAKGSTKLPDATSWNYSKSLYGTSSPVTFNQTLLKFEGRPPVALDEHIERISTSAETRMFPGC